MKHLSLLFVLMLFQASYAQTDSASTTAAPAAESSSVSVGGTPSYEMSTHGKKHRKKDKHSKKKSHKNKEGKKSKQSKKAKKTKKIKPSRNKKASNM